MQQTQRNGLQFIRQQRLHAANSTQRTIVHSLATATCSKLNATDYSSFVSNGYMQQTQRNGLQFIRQQRLHAANSTQRTIVHSLATATAANSTQRTIVHSLATATCSKLNATDYSSFVSNGYMQQTQRNGLQFIHQQRLHAANSTQRTIVHSLATATCSKLNTTDYSSFISNGYMQQTQRNGLQFIHQQRLHAANSTQRTIVHSLATATCSKLNATDYSSFISNGYMQQTQRNGLQFIHQQRLHAANSTQRTIVHSLATATCSKLNATDYSSFVSNGYMQQTQRNGLQFIHQQRLHAANSTERTIVHSLATATCSKLNATDYSSFISNGYMQQTQRNGLQFIHQQRLHAANSTQRTIVHSLATATCSKLNATDYSIQNMTSRAPCTYTEVM